MQWPRGRSFINRLKFQSRRWHVDPSQLAAGAGSGTPPVPTEDNQLLADMKKYQNESPEVIVAKIKELRSEAKDRRIEGQQAKAAAAELEARLLEAHNEINILKKAQTDAETAKLIEKEKYKEAWEKSEQEKITLVAAKDKSLIESALKSKALELNIDPKLLPLLKQDGISVDSQGIVTGLEQAFSKMLENNKEIIEALRASKGTAGAGAADPPAASGDPNNPAEKMLIPGTNMTYGDYNRQLSSVNAGSRPPESKPGSKPISKPDFSKMNRQEQEVWYKDWKNRNLK